MQAVDKLAAINQALQLSRKSIFYHNRIPERPLSSLDELKGIPLTTKDDLRINSPFGLIAVPRSQLYQYHESFGTTGIPVSSWFTREDIEDIATAFRGWGVNVCEDDTVLIRFPYAISSPAHMLQTAAQSQGACVIPASSRSTVSPFPRIINLLRKLEVTVLAGLPLQMILIAETAELLGLNPREDFPQLRAICTAGEPLPPKRRQLIEQIWGKPVFDHYGMTEFGPLVIDCEYQLSHLQEDCFYYELLADDLESDVKEGETGYLVLTTLKRRASPIIRYMTGDRARLIETECSCGKKNILQIRGRQEDCIVANNRVLDRWDLEDIVANFPCRRFWIAGPNECGIQLVVEQENSNQVIENELIEQIQNSYNLRINIELVPRGTLYDRSELLAVGVVGKPKYIYSEEEIKEKDYIKSVRT